ncbi:MAG: hypothetical protein U1E19_10755 [Rhodoblastus sp.]
MQKRSCSASQTNSSSSTFIVPASAFETNFPQRHLLLQTECCNHSLRYVKYSLYDRFSVMVDPADATIAILGPTSFGKTTLLGSMAQCMRRRGYALRPDVRVDCFESNESKSVLPQDLVALSDYRRLEEQILRGIGGTTADQAFEYHFEFEVTEGGQRTLTPVTIVDMAGSVSAISRANAASDGDQQRTNTRFVREILPSCNALVVVLPFLELSAESDFGLLPRFLQSVAANAEAVAPRLQRIAIALTGYEELFIDFGANAFWVASDRGIARSVLTAHARVVRGVFDEHLFERFKRSKIDVLLFPTSAYGFVLGNGCPNVVPDRRAPTPILDTARTTRGSDVWVPFCTADPFIFAATGRRSALSFEPAELGEAMAPAAQYEMMEEQEPFLGAPQVEKPGGAPTRRRFWRW